jgi:hypothetical protein
MFTPNSPQLPDFQTVAAEPSVQYCTRCSKNTQAKKGVEAEADQDSRMVATVVSRGRKWRKQRDRIFV